jgi:membrane protease YdiL (CAAX protease family)
VDPRSLITSTLVLYGGVLVVAVIWGLIDGRRNIFLLPGRGPVTPGFLGAVVGLAAGLAVVGLSRLTVRWFAWARALHREFNALLQGLTTGQALVLAVASAVGEEALFRGAALPTVGLWWSSVLFGAAHVPVRRGLWPWPIMAFGMGLVFGWMFLEFGDLTGPILAHATINFLNLRYIAKDSCWSSKLARPKRRL